MGRGTSGVRGITLKGPATMLGMEITNGNNLTTLWFFLGCVWDDNTTNCHLLTVH